MDSRFEVAVPRGATSLCTVSRPFVYGAPAAGRLGGWQVRTMGYDSMFGFSMQTLRNYALALHDQYVKTIPYHNFFHAVDVMQVRAGRPTRPADRPTPMPNADTDADGFSLSWSSKALVRSLTSESSEFDARLWLRLRLRRAFES